MLKKNDWLFLILFLIFYVFYLFIFKSEFVKYNFNPEIIEKYKRSQDIDAEVENRIFLSDSDIYLSAGYLYSNGESPTSYNFQHPPLIKYLFGFLIKLFDNPFIIQFVFGIIFIYLTYFLGKKVFKNQMVSVFSVLLIFFDPVFQNQLEGALLDLGQSVFGLGYFISFILLPNNFLVQGILLGFFASSKFWTAAIVFFGILNFYKLFILKKRLNIKKVILTLLISVLTFSLIYLKEFIDSNFTFNIVFHQLKILKFMINHNFSPVIGSSILLFMIGRFPKWWGDFKLIKADLWNFIWPIALSINLASLIGTKMENKKKIIFLITPLYLVSIISGVAFSRYFLIILPFLYLSFSFEIICFLKKSKYFQKIKRLV